MGYIEQFYTWSTANVLTAARLNGNISAIIDGLDAGSKDINIAKLKIAGSDVIDSSQNFSISGDILNSSATSAKPVLTIKNTNADANSSELQFYKLSASPADNDNVGVINFYGNDDGENKTLFGKILVESTDVTNGTEDGKITLYSMKAGTSTASLTISSGAVTCNVSLDIAGSGATVTGILDEDDMSSNSAVKLATQQSIKAYVDAAILTTDTWQEVMTNGNTFYVASNDGNPQMRIGATDAEELHIQAVYDSGAQTLDYIIFQTDVASGTADKGEFRFNVDGTEIFHVNDSGVNVVSGKAFYINDTSVLNATTLGGAVVNSSLTSVGTLTTLTVDNVIVNGTTIGHTSDTDLMTLASGVLTVAGEISVTTLDIGGTNVTSTAAELNYVDVTAGTATASKAVVLDGSKNIATLGTVGCGAITSTGTSAFGDVTIGGGYGSTGVTVSAAGVIQANGNIETSSSFVIGSASMDETDLEKLDGITNGTAAANKAVVLEGSKNIATLGTVGCGAITSTGTSSFAVLGVSGNVTVNTSQLFIDTDNDEIGFGTASPDKPFHFEVSNTNTSAMMKIKQAGSGDPTVLIGTAATNFAFGLDNSDSDTFKMGFGAELQSMTLGLTMLSTGKVGVGVTTPTGVFHVRSAANLTESGAHIQIEGSGYGGFHFLDATAYYIGQNSAGRTLRLYSSAETAGAELSAGGTSFGTFSDERVKTGVMKIENAVSDLMKLRCVKFNYKMDPETQGKRLGLIAQDLLGVFDEAVYKGQGWGDLIQDENEYYSVTYTDMIPPIIAAIQELSKKIDAL